MEGLQAFYSKSLRFCLIKNRLNQNLIYMCVRGKRKYKCKNLSQFHVIFLKIKTILNDINDLFFEIFTFANRKHSFSKCHCYEFTKAKSHYVSKSFQKFCFLIVTLYIKPENCIHYFFYSATNLALSDFNKLQTLTNNIYIMKRQ